MKIKAQQTKGFMVDVHCTDWQSSIRRYGGGGRRWGGGRGIGSVGVVIHIATHSEEKPFNCTQCDHSCTTTSHLRQHMLRHSGERHSVVSGVTILALKLVIWRGTSSNILQKRIACKQCSYSCRHSGGTKYHMLSHTGEKTFACKKCNFSCTIASRLNPHMLIDSGEKTFSCTRCDFSCITACGLKRHMPTHSGEKPFKLRIWENTAE